MKLNRGELSVAELAVLLNSWLVEHIQGMDRAFASHCRDKAELVEQAVVQAGPALGTKGSVITRPTVYLIDDEPELLVLLSDVVELAGLNARGYTQASRFFEQVPVFESDSILVLDLQMPEMDGIEVMRRLAQMTDAPSLILISGQDLGVLHAAEKLGR
ncbi:MAG: response regulator, partial [Gammaproteobacteria bacterium]|nr:response regulator [Gammaproteobacteria bacterium]